MESADVVIAGGGIMGCALAYQLAKRNVDVLLLERETLGSQSTGKCAGGVRQQFSMEANVRLQRMSVRMLEGFEQETGHAADFRQIGYLFVLTLPQQVEDFRTNMEMWHRVGLTEARWVDPGRGGAHGAGAQRRRRPRLHVLPDRRHRKPGRRDLGLRGAPRGGTARA